MRHPRRWVVPITASALLGGVLVPPAQANSVPAAPSKSATAHAANPTKAFGSGAASSNDIAVNAFGDGQGYHIQIGSERSGFAWREVALLRPDGLDDSSWTGYQCTSGDGRYEAVAVLPISAANNTSALEHGAFAYSVDLQTGKVRPIATGVALRYFSPDCGTSDLAAFTVSLGDSEQTTEILTANLANGAVDETTTVAGELTSAVPTATGIVAAVGNKLVSVPMANGTAKAKVLSTVPGEAFELRAATDGGVDFLAMTPGAKSASIAHEHNGTISIAGSGPAANLSLFQGRAGHNTVVGASGSVKGSTLRAVSAGGLGSVAAASLNGDALLGGQQKNTTADNRILATTTGSTVTQPASTIDAPVTTAYSSLVPAGVPAATGTASPAAPAPTPTAKQKTTTDAASMHRVQDGAGAAVQASNAPMEAPVIEPAAAQTPACAVPRLSPTFQVMQPGSAQVDWAVQMAEQGLLTGSQYTRPANYDNMGLAAYAPSSDFSEHALDHPSTDTWSTVPRSVYEAIMAQESNWDQASWHALPGIAGDPIISDYYGAAGTISTINYSAADCGYGIGQVTTGMLASETGQQYSLHGQEKIAVDYQENIAAGLQILEDTWNQLYTAGITINGGDPKYLENWYYAIWAYNTGIEPNAAHGNTSNCTPSSKCESTDGTWGLGWANNPANPAFPPNRQSYLQTTYGDAAHPGNWPYQERVLGWMGSPLIRMNSHAYATPTYNGGESWLQIPTFATFCTTAGDDCTPPANAGGSGNCTATNPCEPGTCTLADSYCWWHLPVTYISTCSTTCATSAYAVGSGSSEPSVSDPHPPVCSLNTSVVPSSSIIVSAQVGLASGATPLNIVGCGASNWSNNGSFTMSYGTDSNGDPIGAIDTHQLGAGFGGHIMFTHTENGSNPAIMNTGTWTPNLPSLQYYKIKLHIPATGARATDVVYTINPGGNASPWKIRVNQDWESDQWVTIGTFAMENGGNVQLSNQSSMTPGNYDVGYDAVAFVPEGGTPGTPIGGPPGVKDAPNGSNPAWVECGCTIRTAGDPVDTATGDFGDTATDLSTPGRGMPLDFTRTYASALSDPNGPNAPLAVNGPFGYGWMFSYGLSAATDGTTGNVTITQEDGSEVAFVDSSGTYATSAPRYDATLTKSGSSYIYTRTSNQVYTFDVATGRLTAETDLAGELASTPYATTLAYNSGGQLSTITDPAGHVYTLGWTGTHITSLSDSAQREVTYGYDSAGDLTDVYGVATVRSPSLEDNDHTTYTYTTTTHLLTGERKPKYFGDTTTSPTPAMSMVYDSSDRVTSQTDPKGQTTTFAYGPSTSPSLTAGQTLVTDPSGHQTLNTYQGGLLVTETAGYGTSAASTTSYTYDPVTLGVSTKTDPNGNVETYSYDDHGNLISESDGLGYTTAYTYDTFDDLTAKIDPLGIETSYGYDQAGHIAVSGGTNNGTLTYGQPTSETVTQLQQSAEIVDSNPGVMPSRTINYYYDDAAHPGDRTRTVDANGNTTTTAYDAYGNLASTTDPDGNTAKYGYNTATGWLTTEVSPNGVAAGVAPTCTPPAAGCTTYAHDPYGRVTITTDPLGHTTKNAYDADGNLLTSTDADGNVTTYGYDADDRQTSVEAPDTTSEQTTYNPDGTVAYLLDGAGHKTSYGYDAQGRDTSQIDADNRTTSYTYDGDGNVLTVTNHAQQTTTYSYDAGDQLTKVAYSDGSTPNVAYTYDPDGNRASMTDGTGTSTWSYDAFGEVVATTNGAGSTVGYSYDDNGNQTSIIYPGGAAQTVTEKYDKANRLTSEIDWNSKATSFSYDNDGNATKVAYPDGVTINTGYDTAEHLSSTAAATSTSTLASVSYTRDNAGQVLTMTPTGLPESNETYAYTTLNQLKSASSGSNTADYSYDAARNPTENAGSGEAFDAAHQLCWTLPGTASTSGCGTAPTGATTYTYNSQGDRTAATPSTGTASTYAYNQADEMTADTGAAGSASYAYSGNGLRASKTVGSITNTFTWDDSSVPNLLGDGATDYIYGPDGLPIEQIGSNGSFWYFHDGVGSTVALLDSNGGIAGAYGYNAYGSVIGYTGTATTPLQFAAGYTDAETGFVYLRARYYDPATAEFLTVDPLLNATQAAYTYVNDNPLNLTDPSGDCPGLVDSSRGNYKSNEFQGWTDEQLEKAYKDPNTSAAMKQRIKLQQKANGTRRSRGSNSKKAKGSGGKSSFMSDIQTGAEWTLGILAVAAVITLAVIFFPVEAVVGVGAAIFGGLAAIF